MVILYVRHDYVLRLQDNTEQRHLPHLQNIKGQLTFTYDYQPVSTTVCTYGEIKTHAYLTACNVLLFVIINMISSSVSTQQESSLFMSLLL